jgi:hypothetical protein
MMFWQEHGPLIHGQGTNSLSDDTVFINITLNARLTISVSAGINGIGKNAVNGGIGGSDPANLTAPLQRERQTLREKPEPNLTCGTEFSEALKDGPNGATNSFIGMKKDFAVFLATDKAYGQTAVQFTACSFVTDTAIETGTEDMEFCFTHGALEAEDQTIVEKRRMIQPVTIADQSVSQAAKIKQAIPIGIIARESRNFEA